MTNLDDDPRLVAILDDGTQLNRLGDLLEAFKETANFELTQVIYKIHQTNLLDFMKMMAWYAFKYSPVILALIFFD